MRKGEDKAKKVQDLFGDCKLDFTIDIRDYAVSNIYDFTEAYCLLYSSAIIELAIAIQWVASSAR